MKIEMSKYKGRKLLRELKIEEKRLSVEIRSMTKSRESISKLIELMKSGLNQD